MTGIVINVMSGMLDTHGGAGSDCCVIIGVTRSTVLAKEYWPYVVYSGKVRRKMSHRHADKRACIQHSTSNATDSDTNT